MVVINGAGIGYLCNMFALCIYLLILLIELEAEFGSRVYKVRKEEAIRCDVISEGTNRGELHNLSRAVQFGRTSLFVTPMVYGCLINP